MCLYLMFLEVQNNFHFQFSPMPMYTTYPSVFEQSFIFYIDKHVHTYIFYNYVF